MPRPRTASPAHEPQRRAAPIPPDQRGSGRLLFAAKVKVHQLIRGVENLRRGPRMRALSPHRGDWSALGVAKVRVDRSDNPAERALDLGKIENLRHARMRLDGLIIPAGEVFSFWAQVGRLSRRRGHALGREIRGGCVIPSIGGGICLLTDALHAAAIESGVEVIERHSHGRRERASIGDATVFWNYLDLRLRPSITVQLRVDLGADELEVSFLAARAGGASAAAPSPLPRLDRYNHCTGCEATDCARKAELPRPAVEDGSVQLLDWLTPEGRRLVDRLPRPDRRLAPLRGDGVRWTRYALPSGTASVAPHIPLARSLASRGFAKRGALRSAAMLELDRRAAERLAGRLDYRVESLLVPQHLLPHLWASGALAGRDFDVLIQALPLFVLAEQLDEAARLHPMSRSLREYRPSPSLLRAEREALDRARRVFTAHDLVARRLDREVEGLEWVLPEVPAWSQPSRELTLCFAGSVLGRKGAYEFREAARALGARVITPPGEHEGESFFAGLEHRTLAFEQASRQAHVFVDASWVEHRPGLALRAIASGMPTVVSDATGLSTESAALLYPAGDVEALVGAIDRALGAT